jgi:hypothetical protein
MERHEGADLNVRVAQELRLALLESETKTHEEPMTRHAPGRMSSKSRAHSLLAGVAVLLLAQLQSMSSAIATHMKE